MADWVTHIRIAEALMERGSAADVLSFCVGSIAPDCNVENADWTEFVPPRNITHWMRGSGKDSADAAGFFAKYLSNDEFSPEARSFYLGYYAHLLTDVEYHNFLRGPQVKRAFLRLQGDARICGAPEEFATLKSVFGRKGFDAEQNDISARYIAAHPECFYHKLGDIAAFPNYLDYMPDGAIVRKIGVMAGPRFMDGPHLLITGEELDGFIADTADIIFNTLAKKRII